ncbi:hypothetical protein BJY59DRAFT_268988 [Rhodotorula toruloides]
MARFAARHAGMEGRPPPPPPPPGPLAARLGGPSPHAGAPGATGLSGQAEPLPQHLADALSGLYAANLPESATLAECRDFFDQCDDLVGLTLTAPEPARGGMYRSVWLAFSDKQARDRAKPRTETTCAETASRIHRRLGATNSMASGGRRFGSADSGATVPAGRINAIARRVSVVARETRQHQSGASCDATGGTERTRRGEHESQQP